MTKSRKHGREGRRERAKARQARWDAMSLDEKVEQLEERGAYVEALALKKKEMAR